MLSASLTFWLAAAAMIAVALAFVLPALLRRDPLRAAPRRRPRCTATSSTTRPTRRCTGRPPTLREPATRQDATAERLDLDAVARAPRRARRRDRPPARRRGAVPRGRQALRHRCAERPIPPPATADDAFRSQLQAHLASSPRDGRAWVTLARLEMNADRFNAARRGVREGLRRLREDRAATPACCASTPTRWAWRRAAASRVRRRRGSSARWPSTLRTPRHWRWRAASPTSAAISALLSGTGGRCSTRSKPVRPPTSSSPPRSSAPSGSRPPPCRPPPRRAAPGG